MGKVSNKNTNEYPVPEGSYLYLARKIADGVFASRKLPFEAAIQQIIESHTDQANPHSQYATQVAFAAHAADTGNPHGVTAAQVGADPAGTAASEVAAHESNPNPHPQYAVTWSEYNNGSDPTTAPEANFTDALALGNGAVAGATYAFAFLGNVTGQDGIALGRLSSAATYGVAAGNDADAGAYSVAVGNLAKAASNYQTSVGYNCNVTGQYGVGVGGGNFVSASGAAAFGYSSSATAAGAIAFGRDATASGANAIAVGQDSQATYQLSVAHNGRSQYQGQFHTTTARILDGGVTPDYNCAHGFTTRWNNTTNATPSLVGRISLPAAIKFARVQVKVLGYESATGDIYTETLDFLWDNVASAVVGTVNSSHVKSDGALTVSIGIHSATNAFSVEATGEVGKTIKWVSSFETVTIA